MSEANPEDEYFARLDLEKKRKMRAELNANEAEESLKLRKETHWNKCGKCGEDMETVGFRGVEIEVCPSCGAVLLDKGELEALAGRDQGGALSGLFGSLFGSSS